MNRISLLLAAAAAVVLVLFLSEPAHACHRGEPHGKHTSCDGGGDGGGGGGGGGGGDDDTSDATYLISVDPHETPDPVTSPLYDPPADCLGTNPDQKGSGVSFDVVMPKHECATVVTSENYLLTDDIRIWVTTDDNGDIVSVQLIGQDIIGSEGLQHRSDLIPVAPQTPNLSGDFTLHVDADNVTIWKCDAHRIKRNTNCDVDVGTISMGDFTYILQ